MTVSRTLRSAGPFVGNGVTTAFPFAFKVFTVDDIEVTFTDASGVASVITTGYTVALNADQNTSPGGTITYPVSGAPMAAPATLAIVGDAAYEQRTDITNAGRFLPEVIENALDLVTILVQQVFEKVGRALVFPAGEAAGTLPSATARAGKFLAFDAGGGVTSSSGTGADAGLRTDLAASTGSGLLGWLQAGVGAVVRAVRDKLRERISVADFGAVGDGATDDYAAIAAAITAAGAYRSIEFPKTATNIYCTSQALKFLPGQRWVGCGGLDVVAAGTQIKLTAASTSVCEPSITASVNYGFNPIGIYFNAQGNADAGLSLYNTSYALVDQCAALVSKAGAAAILLDSDTVKQCYFNRINVPRVFANGVGSAGIRFTRGANANQVIGGKCGSSTRGMEFLSASSGNLVIGTDFETNSDRHIYVDAPNNVFIGTHMEAAPIGFDITANGTNTQRMNTTYATSTVINVQDASKIGTVLDTKTETAATTGNLRFGPAKVTAKYLGSGTTIDHDPDLFSGTANAVINFFRNLTTSGTRQIAVYKGDGSGNLAFKIDASTGEVTHGDIQQDNGAGLYRMTLRRSGLPATASVAGDMVNRTNPSSANAVTQWTCIASGTPGTWQSSGWVVGRGITANRPAVGAEAIGVMYFDTTLVGAGQPIWWTGTIWVDATGTAV